MRSTFKKVLRGDVVPTLAVVGVTMALGVGVAFAAIGGMGDDGAVAAAQRTLSPVSGIMLKHAFGTDDEDCVYATRLTMLPDGRQHPMQQLVCDQ